MSHMDDLNALMSRVNKSGDKDSIKFVRKLIAAVKEGDRDAVKGIVHFNRDQANLVPASVTKWLKEEAMWTRGGNMANSYEPKGEDMSEQSGRMASIAAAAKKIGAGSKPSAKKSGSFAAYFKTRQDSTFATNALRFATKEEAEAYARNLFMRWLGASEWKVEPDTDPPNYVFANGQATPIKESSEDHDEQIQEDEWGGGFQTYKDAHKEVQAGLRADMVKQRNKTLALMVQVIRGEISKQKFKKLTSSSFDDLMKNAKWYINQIKKMPKSKLAPVAPASAAPTATESVDMDIQEAEKAVAPNDDELRRLLDAAKEILYGRGGGHSYFQRDAEAKKLVNKAKKFAMVTRNQDLLADWKNLNYHLKGVKVRKPKPNLNRSFGGVHDPRSYGRGGVADSYEAEGDDIQETANLSAREKKLINFDRDDFSPKSLEMHREAEALVSMFVGRNVIAGGTTREKIRKAATYDYKRNPKEGVHKAVKAGIDQLLRSGSIPRKVYMGTGIHPIESLVVDAEDIQEKVEIDGRTRAYRDTVMRLEQARKIRKGRSRAMQENRFGGLYDDGSGKGAMIPAPVDFNFHEAMKVVEKYRSLREKKKMLFGAPKGKMEDLNAAVAMKDGKFSMQETKLSPKQKEYRAFFAKALKKFGHESPADMDDGEKKKFFNWVEKNWKG
jgi:hypothetical protein